MLHLRQTVTKLQAGINHISTSTSATRRTILTRTTKEEATASAILPLRSSSLRVALQQQKQEQEQNQDQEQEKNNRFINSNNINGTSFLQVQSTLLSALLGEEAGQHNLRQRQSEENKNFVSTPRPPLLLSLREISQHSLNTILPKDPQPIYNNNRIPIIYNRSLLLPPPPPPPPPSSPSSFLLPSLLKKPSIILKRAYFTAATTATTTRSNSYHNNNSNIRNMTTNGNTTTTTTPNGKNTTSNTTNGNSRPSCHSHINFHDDHGISELLARNEKWAGAINETHQELFPKTGVAQNPKILWLGCSDSRCPETTLLDLCPGEVFVHRNIANCLPPTDLSCQSVIEFSVVHVKVKHVIVCGHYGCGGVQNALSNKKLGILDLWLKNVKAVIAEHAEELDAIKSPEEREKRLVHLNVMAQTQNLLRNANVQEAIKNRGMQVHSLIYDVTCGRLIKVDVPSDKKRKAFMLEE